MESRVVTNRMMSDVKFVTPAMFMGDGISVSAALQAMCDYAKQCAVPVIATGFSGTLDASLVIDGIQFIGGGSKATGRSPSREMCLSMMPCLMAPQWYMAEGILFFALLNLNIRSQRRRSS